jgi:hypothetical protein
MLATFATPTLALNRYTATVRTALVLLIIRLASVAPLVFNRQWLKARFYADIG